MHSGALKVSRILEPKLRNSFDTKCDDRDWSKIIFNRMYICLFWFHYYAWLNLSLCINIRVWLFLIMYLYIICWFEINRTKSSPKQKADHAKWKNKNYVSLIILKDSIFNAIHKVIPDADNAKEFPLNIEEQFKASIRAPATTLISKMVTLKYKGSSGIHDYIMIMNDMVFPALKVFSFTS